MTCFFYVLLTGRNYEKGEPSIAQLVWCEGVRPAHLGSNLKISTIFFNGILRPLIGN